MAYLKASSLETRLLKRSCLLPIKKTGGLCTAYIEICLSRQSNLRKLSRFARSKTSNIAAVFLQ